MIYKLDVPVGMLRLTLLIYSISSQCPALCFLINVIILRGKYSNMWNCAYRYK